MQVKFELAIDSRAASMNAIRRQRSRGSFVLNAACVVLVCCALPFGRCQEWSGFVNSLGARVNYSCPDDQVITGLASDFSATTFDRQWEFQCDTGGGLANVSTTCTLQSPINSFRGLIDFACPSEGYISGFVSEFDASQTDRLWQPYCCTRPFSSLINCQTLVGGWENPLRGNLNYTGPTDNHVVAGIQSFYFNRDRRWRFTSCEVEVNCGDPGIVENAVRVGSSFLYGDQVTYTCNDGYYQSSGAVGGVRTCLDTGLWSDTQPECTLCTDIPDCEAILCTNSTDHVCSQCRSNNGTGLGEFAFANLITECEPRCSWLGTFCFPGMCPGDLSSCNCSTGFEGEDCLNITESPLLLSCALTLHGSDGREVMAECTNTTTQPIFTNIVPSELEADWTVSYTGPATPPQPAYVDDYEVGVAISEIRAFDYRAANPNRFITSSTHDCVGPAPSPDSPVPDVVVCSTGATPTNLTAHTFLHGDTFEVQSFASAGGFLDILNLDTSTVARHYYSGIPTFGLSSFIIDIIAPTHCSLVAPSNGCLQGQRILDLGGEIVEDNMITASWGGWIDVPSGVTHYEIRVYPLQLVGGMLSEMPVSINMTMYNHQNSRVIFEDINILPSEGPYAFILMTFDLAGNVRLSRRLLLYDNTSIVEIDQTVPLRFISAVPESEYQWQNSTSDPLIVTGIGHFYNTFLRSNNYLAPVANSSIGDIDPDFDHPPESGRYPRSGTVNAQGIVRVLYDVIIDQEGGRSLVSITSPTNFPYETTDVGIEAVQIVDTELNDGDSVTVWFQVIDFRFQTNIDSTLVHIDSSPPALTDLWLEWNGDTGLNLHGTDSLLDLTIQFQTYDVHSGIYAVEWSIRTRHGDVGYGILPVQNVNETICFAPDCFCDSLLHCSLAQYSFSPLLSNFFSFSEALHDTDYTLSVTVTNFARLSSTLEHSFTVDTTPPTPGTVFDGLQLPDIDYQDHQTLNAWWTGFFDRETDIPFYQYIFANSCADADIFSYPLNMTSGVSQTRLTSTSWEAPGEDTYYITVVAYNNALQPSNPVCSDGITVDLSPPTFVGVSIPGARVKPGLVVDSGGQFWLVERERERVRIDGYSGWCTNSSTLVEDLSAFPVKRFRDGSIATLPADECRNYSPFIPSQPIYLRGDHALNVSWFARDNVGFREFYVGIVAEQNYTGATSQIEYSETGGQMHFSIYDPDLIANGNAFYISVKSPDVALHEVRLDIGPIIVDVSPPVVNGSLSAVQAGDHMIVTWEEGTFYDEESMELLQLEYAIGRSEFSEDVQYFRPIPSPDPSHCSTPHCFTIDLASLGSSIVSGHDYIITIRAINSAGLMSYSTSNPPFTYIYGLPSVGVVFDIDSALFPELIDGINYHDLDVDVLLDPSELGARWTGFLHPHLNVTFSVSLGTRPFSQDVVAMTVVGENTSYVFDGTYLNHSITYYITVSAENSIGQVSATSDGVLVLHDLEKYLHDATVYDGLFEVDVDYQASSSSASSHWVFPASIRSYTSHYKLALMRIVDNTNFTLEQVSEFENVGLQSFGSLANLQLVAREKYVAGVMACFAGSCLDPVYSDGFQLSFPPSVASSLTISAVYSPANLDMEYGISSPGYLEISWNPFHDPQIAYYEWALGTGELGSELLIYWTRTEWFETSVSVNVNATISLHTANVVTVKGYNTAGLYSSLSTELRWRLEDGEVVPQSSVPLSPLTVVDIDESEVEQLATSDWRQRQFQEWDPVDLQYSRSPDSLSGAWPNLRYMRYDYSISTTPTYQSCDSPKSIACGETIANSVTVRGLSLIHGQRYYFCVRGVRGEAIHVTSATPPVFTSCSNGITVDLTPPTGGCVHIIIPSLLDAPAQDDIITGSGSGSGGELRPLLERGRECVYLNKSTFQSSSSELFIGWDQFADVEQYSTAVHVSGVAYYDYAIGSAPLATDVVDFVSVGVATDTVATGLSLQSGHTYYVTVRGVDFTGQSNYSVSHPVTIDTSTPVIGKIWISNTTDYLDELELEWDPVEDLQSDVIGVEWSLGSRPGSSDISGWSSVNLSEAATGVSVRGVELHDGQLVFASMKVMNAAGLNSVSSSLGYILESSPPQGGMVYDGSQSQEGNFDLDYTSDPTSLSAHWGGTFSDPHTGISEYYWRIGSCLGCDDIQGWVSVGIATAAMRSGLTLSNGHTYFITIRACNPYHQCTEASSNGIIVDVTPPIVGRIVSDYRGRDVQFQSSRSFISTHWEGFHDSESSLLHFIYSVSANDSYLLPPTLFPPSHTSLSLPFPLLQLPSEGTIVLSLTAVNRVGLASQPLTSSIFIDSSPPESTGPVVINTQWVGSVAMDTQYSSSLIRASWIFSDNQTTVNKHFWRLVSDSYIRNPIPMASVGTQSDTTALGIELSDGDSYYALVTACNSASLCVQERSSRVLFDSSPPIDGYFAVDLSEAIALNRTVPGGMTWRNRRGRGYAEIGIAFLGFLDPHSGISRYWASVGSGYSLTDLSVPTILDVSAANDENSTYITKIQLNRLLDLNETIYISLWAENGAGLSSHVIQSSFIVKEVPSRNNNGTLTILRSYNCPIDSCLGHCTCAARGDLCTVDPALNSTCQQQDLSMLSADMRLLVSIVTPQQIYSSPGDPLFSASTDKLIGRWEYVNPLSTAIQRVEWSFSEEGLPPGMGLMDSVNDIIWYEADQSDTAIFSVSPSYPLRHGISYVFHARAWYSNVSYAVFTSDSVTIDTVYPSIVRGARTREVEIGESSEIDLDYVSSDSEVEVSWQNVFISSLSGSYAVYEVAIGDTPGADNVYPFTVIPDPSLNRTLIPDLSLLHGRRYYATVRAVSPLGIRVVSISDGFIVDLSPPSPGVVLDGMGMEYGDSVAQYRSERYSARWFGFNDPESGIHHYELALTDSQNQPPNSEYINVGIALRETLTTLTLNHAQTYYAHVIAENNAGLRSYDIVSSGATIDSDDLNRRPLAKPRQSGPALADSNLILNPSFESITATRCNDIDQSIDLATQNWTLQTIYSELVTTSSSSVPYEGCIALLFIGTVSQPVATSPGVEYELSFAMKKNNSLKLSEALVNVPGQSKIIPLFSQKQSGSPDGWVRYSFIFTAPDDSNTSEISLTTIDNSHALLVDDFSIILLNSSTEISAPTGDIIVTWPDAIYISHALISQSWTQLYISWDIFDPDSGVREYLWAVGTVPGGEQLQSYTSTGAERQGVSEWLSLSHGQVVYVSVVAWNYAGLERVVYSRGYTVDLTPPTIAEGGVVDGESRGVDVDFQADSTHFAVNFSACVDPESGVKEIRWALGTARGLTDIEPFNIYPGNTVSAAVDLLTPLPHGLTVHSTVICTNNAGLFTVAYSDGVTVLSDPPLTSDAFLRISTSNLTQFESLDGFLPSTDVILNWGGFQESSGAPLVYEVRLIEEGGGVATNWTNLGHAYSLVLTDLLFEVNATHTVEVRAVSLAGVPSDPLVRNFTIIPYPPQIAAAGDLVNATWISDSELQLEWSETFSSSAPLYFELSLGPQMGSGSILKWVELSTMATSYTITDSRLRRSTDYFVALTAVSYSGLQTTVNQLLAGLPVTG